MAAHHTHPVLAVDTHSATSHPYWHEIRTLGAHPHRRSYHSAVGWNNFLIICGGQDLREGMVPGHWVFSFNADTPELDTWEEMQVTATSPPPICRHSAVVDADQMYLFGGSDNSTESDNTYILNLKTKTWTIKRAEASGLPPPIDNHSAVVHNHEMVVFGGFIGGSRCNQVFTLNLPSLVWSAPATSGTAPSPRSGHTAMVYNSTMIVYGGCNDDGAKLNDVWKLNLPSYMWEKMALQGQVPEGRSGHSVCLYRSIMIVFGGMKDLTKETNEMYGLQLDSCEWSLIQEERKIEDPVSAVQLEEYKKSRSPFHKNTVPAHSPTSLSPPAHKTKHESPVIPGDESPNARKKRPTHLYEGPPSPLLGRIVGRAPYPRDGHSAVLLQDKMFIFGGDRYQMPFNDLYVFAVNDHSIRGR